MTGNTKALRLRIKSVTSTLQLTKAMGLVASSKLRRANSAMLKAKEYSKSLESAVELLTSDTEVMKSPYMRKSEGLSTKIIIIAGDRGMAGGYNANVFRLAKQFEASFLPIGKRACERFRSEIVSSENYTFKDAKILAENLCREFIEEKIDRVGIIYTKYNSAMSQDAVIKWLLPLEKSGSESAKSVLFEPDNFTVFNEAIKDYIAGVIIASIRESFACEVNARRMAMDSAGKNAQQMIDDLSLEYNRARQGAITQEITEIVAGSTNQ